MTSLPTPFRHLNVHYIQQVSATEWCSSCPECGGEPHPNGEPPDRFRMFTDKSPRSWCRKCGVFSFAGNDEKELKAWHQEQVQTEKRKKSDAEQALRLLETFWQDYHANMTKEDRQWWRNRGVADSMQDWWKLGASKRNIKVDGVWQPWPSATIPLIRGGLRNVKHRLKNPPPSAGRYRNEVSGIGASLFWCNPELDIAGEHVIAVEGEIKAMVTWATLREEQQVMVGFPGVQKRKKKDKEPTLPQYFEEILPAGKITLVVDPGAKRSGLDLARRLGIERCWLLEPPMKLDDGLLAAHMGKMDVERLLKSALKLSNYVTGKAG